MDSVKCISTCCNAFYFEVETIGTDVDEDKFSSSTQRFSHWVRSEDNKFLLLTTQGQFQLQNLPELPESAKFHIQIYKDDANTPGPAGRVVMLYIKGEGENMVVYCNKNQSICPAKMKTLPGDINDNKDGRLFYMRSLMASNTFEFESSLHPSSFLGFEPDPDNPSLHKLVLHQKKNEDSNCRWHFF